MLTNKDFNMTSAIKITVGTHSFLLPETHSDYDFPGYIEQHLDLISRYIETIKTIEQCSGTPFSEEMGNAEIRAKFLSSELKEFKEKTGIIGYPLDFKDVNLYAIDHKIDINLVFEFNSK